MKKIIPILIVGILLCTALGAVALKSDVKTQDDTNKGNRVFTHTVFAEDGTATWCSHCPYAHGSLNRIYKIGQYPLLYTSLVADKNVHATARDTEYNLAGYPTVYFDGGYKVDVGSYDNWQQQMSWYNTSIVQSGARAVPDIVTTLNVSWLGNAVMDITIDVKNNDPNLYAGHLHIYVTEVESTMGWVDTQGHKYTFPFLDYAFNGPISIASGDTYTNTINWDGHNYNDGHGNTFGSIQYGNIMIIASVFNATSHQGYSDPPSGYPFNAFYVDDAAGFFVGDIGPNTPSNPNPANGATSVDINKDVSWTGGGTPGLTITYDVYFGTESSPPKVASNQSATTYNPGTLAYSTMYYWKIVAWDQNDNSSEGPIWHFTTINSPNNPPNPPTITGPTNGTTGSTYKYTITGTDPESDTISAYIMWGDGTITDWTTFHDSGVSFTLTHSWTAKGTYTVQVKVKDEHGAESGWATLKVTMPTSFELTNPFLHWFFEHFPNAFPVLRQLLGV
jgi:hypothetical protein